MDLADALKILEALASIYGRVHKMFKYVHGVAISIDSIVEQMGELEISVKNLIDLNLSKPLDQDVYQKNGIQLFGLNLSRKQ